MLWGKGREYRYSPAFYVNLYHGTGGSTSTAVKFVSTAQTFVHGLPGGRSEVTEWLKESPLCHDEEVPQCGTDEFLPWATAELSKRCSEYQEAHSTKGKPGKNSSVRFFPRNNTFPLKADEFGGSNWDGEGIIDITKDHIQTYWEPCDDAQKPVQVIRISLYYPEEVTERQGEEKEAAAASIIEEKAPDEPRSP